MASCTMFVTQGTKRILAINLKDEYPDSGACKEVMVKINILSKMEILPATKLGSFILFWLL